MAIELISQLDKLQGIHKTMLEYRQIQTGCLLIELLLTLSREYISEFLVQKNTATSKSLRTVYDIIAFLDSSYSTDITGDLLEEKFNCNFDYINRVFKETLGKTIFTYLNRLRIEKAKQFLSTQIYSLTDVAEKTGFHDVYYFSKVFKKYVGITPGAYMNQLT
jgi:YesN/AraC family two-component response regulator